MSTNPSLGQRFGVVGVVLVTLLAVVLFPGPAALASAPGSTPGSAPESTPESTSGPAVVPPTVVGQACAPNTGVTVVVDFTTLADVIEIGCALGTQSNGFAALANAGFGVNVDSGSYPGTVCTLDGVPTQGYPYCWVGGGNWSYWVTDGSTPWAYSSGGAGSATSLPVGSVQGWSWQVGITPAAPRLAVAALVDHDDPSPADAAIVWAKRELAAHHWSLPDSVSESIDVGLTIDALLALGADGRSATPAAIRVTEVVRANTTNFVSWAPEHPNVTVASAMAKTLLAAAIQGADVSDFAGWDLETELRSMMQTSGPQTGRFSDDDPEYGTDASNGFSQGLAVLALARTAGGAPGDAVTYLLAQQCPGSGFRVAYAGGRTCTDPADSDTDATALAVQALLALDRTPEVQAALAVSTAWLHTIQDPVTGAFGGTGITAGINTNTSGLAAQSLRAAGQLDIAGQVADWVGSQQLVPPSAGAASVDVGAIAYNRANFDAAVASGISSNGRDQWRRATTQALLAFGLPALGSINVVDSVPSVTPANPFQFSDVAPGSIFHNDIVWLVAAGVTEGYPDGTFGPTGSLTRQANAAFLYRLAGRPPFAPSGSTFTDVPIGSGFHREIEWMYAEGLTTGFPDNTFRPGERLSRQAMASFLYRLAGEPDVTPGAPTFTDVPVGHQFHDAVSWLAAVGVTQGYADGTFRPEEPVARQAMAAFVHRYTLLP